MEPLIRTSKRESFHVTSFKSPFPTCLVLRASGIRGHSLTSEPLPPAQVALVVKNPPANAGYGRCGFIPGSGRSPGVGNGNPLQYTCLENIMNRGAWLQSMGLQRAGHDGATKHVLPPTRSAWSVLPALSFPLWLNS